MCVQSFVLNFLLFSIAAFGLIPIMTATIIVLLLLVITIVTIACSLYLLQSLIKKTPCYLLRMILANYKL